MCIKLDTCVYRRASLMVKMLCYGHGDTSSNPVRVIITIYSLFLITISNKLRFKTTALIAQR